MTTHSLRRLRRKLEHDLGTLFGPAVEAARLRRWRRFWLGAVTSLAVALLGGAFRTRWGHAFIEQYAITRPADRWGTVALRLPLSMFAPAALLPFWFAVVQVGAVYGLGQAILGVGRTVLIATLGHTLATCSAHLWILLGRPLGVGHGYANFGDAGPSVAVVTVIAYLVVVRGAGWLLGLLGAYDAIEIVVFNGLSQREHLLGVITGALVGGVARLPAARAARSMRMVPVVPVVPAGTGGEADPAQYDPAQYDPAQYDPAQYDPAEFGTTAYDETERAVPL